MAVEEVDAHDVRDAVIGVCLRNLEHDAQHNSSRVQECRLHDDESHICEADMPTAHPRARSEGRGNRSVDTPKPYDDAAFDRMNISIKYIACVRMQTHRL